MARVSAMGKLCCVLQADYAAVVKEAACAVLRLERVALRQRIPALINISDVTHWVTRDTERSEEERSCGGSPTVAAAPARAPACLWRACLCAHSGGGAAYYSRTHNVFGEMKGQ